MVVQSQTFPSNVKDKTEFSIYTFCFPFAYTFSMHGHLRFRFFAILRLFFHTHLTPIFSNTLNTMFLHTYSVKLFLNIRRPKKKKKWDFLTETSHSLNK